MPLDAASPNPNAISISDELADQRAIAGDYEAAVKASHARAEADKFYDANPGGANVALQLRSYGEIAFEIYDELRDAPAAVAVPVSNGTTLAYARMIRGLLPASGGVLQVAGVDVRKTAAKARARIGYMSQKFSLYGTLSVLDNLRFFSSAYGLTGSRRRERIGWATADFELASVAENHSGSLPLGYKQRLALACALMHEPEIIFLDEPTSGVDPLARREFWHRINTLAAQNVTVLVTTHFMEEAQYCDRLAIMMTGEILALGTPTEIKRRARSKEHRDPTMEDAFIRLIETHASETRTSGTQ